MKYLTYFENGAIEIVGEAPDSYIPMLQMVHPTFFRYGPLDSEAYVPIIFPPTVVDVLTFKQEVIEAGYFENLPSIVDVLEFGQTTQDIEVVEAPVEEVPE